ncbi:EAL domain-containing protein [Myxococcota bacterium]|nr:EAL domain-containing protein [Myxococcota bacterium]
MATALSSPTVRHPSTSSRDAATFAELERALADDELVLVYQPLFDARLHRAVGCEALLRWHRRSNGTVLPAEFVPMLEQSGLIVPVGAWVIERACAQLRQWINEGRATARISVNLSAVQFEHDGLVECVARALAAAHLEAAALEVEITESVLMRDTSRTEATVAALKALGVRIAIDDFGTGYSSLAYLHRFPVDTLKIDKSFVERLGSSRHGDAIVGAIIGLAHKLGIEVVAEGVETDEQRRLLEHERCDLLQGYLLGRPEAP